MKFPAIRVPAIPYPTKFAVLSNFSAALFFPGCAQTTYWKDGDACSQIVENRKEMEDIDARLDRLNADTASQTKSSRESQILALQNKKRDLGLSSERLAPNCKPSLDPIRSPKEPRVGDQDRQR